MGKLLTCLLLLILLCTGCGEEDIRVEPPEMPLNVAPLNGDTLIASSIVFQWLSLDDKTNSLSYDFYLSNDPDPELLHEDLKTSETNVTNLESGQYYWQVIARNTGGSTLGRISEFYLINPDDMPVLQTVDLVSKEKSKVQLQSSISTLDEVSDHGFVISRYAQPSKSDRVVSNSGSSLNFAVEIDQLYDGITYYARAFATTSLGTIYSDEFSFEAWDDEDPGGLFVDVRDGKEYSYKRIGSQKWMTQNLAYLPTVNDPFDGSLSEPKFYVYDYFGEKLSEAEFEPTYQTYGTLYNWAAVMMDDVGVEFKAQGVCPTGWHVPNDEEWEILFEHIGGRAEGGGKLKEEGFEHWQEPNTGATNSYGFSALPAGARGVGEFPFQTLGTRTFWWSATQRDEEFANRKYLYNEYSAIGDYHQLKSVGFSIRCVKD